jgi:hypothetical protein
MFMKEKESGLRLNRSAEATTDNVIEEIKERLRWIETPILLEDFEKKLVENLTQPVWGKRPCNTVEVEWGQRARCRRVEKRHSEESGESRATLFSTFLFYFLSSLGDFL